jgi:hypothetical protein
MKARLILTLGLLCSLSPSAYPAEAVPEAVRQYAAGIRAEVTGLIASDPNLMKDIGANSAKEVAKLAPDASRAFLMRRIEAGKVEEAGSLQEAVGSTGTYYVPLCADGRCPVMAAIGMGENGPVFESVGQPNLTRQIAEAEARVTGEVQVVQYPEAGVGFLMTTQANGEKVLVPQSPEEAEAIVRLLGRPSSEKDRNGFPRLALSDLKQLSRRVSEEARNERDFTLPEGFLSDPNEPEETKPFNSPYAVAMPTRVSDLRLPETSEPVPEAAGATAPPPAPKVEDPAPASRQDHRVLAWLTLSALGLFVIRRNRR